LNTVEIIQVIGILVGIIVTIGTVFIAFGRLSERHDNAQKLTGMMHSANVKAIEELTGRFALHTDREDEWQRDQSDRMTRVETTVEHIEEHLKNGYKVKRGKKRKSTNSD
jgi:hypothetical protein